MRLRFTALLILMLSFATIATADDWPQFRGPGGQGHSQAADVPLSWSESENIAWKTEIEGNAWSSPVVLGKTIWLTTAIETPCTPEETKAKREKLEMSVPSVKFVNRVVLKAVCVDRESGRVLKTLTLYDIADPPQICAINSYASPTPVIEEGLLYCDFGTMGTSCVDTASGKVIWKRDFPIEHQVGPGSSPILYGDMLVLTRDGCEEQYIVALDKKTGKNLWKTDRPPMDTSSSSMKKAFSVPIVVDTTAGKQMIVPAAQWICSYNPDTGKELWRVDTGSTFSNTARPVFGAGLAYVGMGFGGMQLLAVKVDGRGNVTDTHVAWKERKGAPRLPSPLLVGDELYMLSDRGVATCMDAKSGEFHWSERILGSCSSSPTVAEGRIYFCDEEGKTVVVKAAKEFAKLAENQLDGRVKASPAIVDGVVFMRTDKHLYRIEKE